MHAVVLCFDDRKIMVMPRTSMNTPDKHGQKNLGFFLQCNGETDSQLVSFIHARVVYELGVVEELDGGPTPFQCFAVHHWGQWRFRFFWPKKSGPFNVRGCPLAVS